MHPLAVAGDDEVGGGEGDVSGGDDDDLVMEMVASWWRWRRWRWRRVGVGRPVVALDGVAAMMVAMMLTWLRGCEMMSEGCR
uniref:Uncharacterized protein n=1 Tax=Tanacetum cinerariifolium TaxID=118510 RepID=A0A6L2JVZ0_TANCI|nr:hypothetical protein [Tanacetum cinerariifolium]